MKPTLQPFKFPLQPLGLLTLLLATTQSLLANEALWIGTNNVSATTNWSDPLNWLNIGAGGTGPYQNAATFDDSTGVGDAVTINNVVNDNENPFSLTYTNLGTDQNTLIAPGQMLSISTGGLTMGNSTALTTAVAPTTTISGAGGTLVVSNGNVTVGLSYPATSGGPATLDLSGLDTFMATNIARILIGQGAGRMSGALYLAKTNYINLTGSSPQLDIGDNSSNNGPGSKLYLGQNNVLLVDSIAMGLKKQNSGGGGALQFNPALAANNPMVYIRGTNGVGPVSTWAIADGQAQSGTITDTGTSDFSGGTVDILVNSMWLARNSTGANAGSSANNATLTFSAGTIAVNNLTNAMLASSARTPNVTGTINVNGGTLTVNNNFVMAATNNFIGGANSTLNINAGTVLANNIVPGGGISVIVMNGGSLTISNAMGSSSSPLTTFSLTSAALRLPAGDSAANATVGNLFLNDSATVVSVSSLPTLRGYPATLPLISYTSFAGGTLNLGALPSTFTGYVSNDNVSTIWVVITNGPSLAKTDEWGGNVNNIWDTSSLNWTNAGVSVAYSEHDFVLFDDFARTNNVHLSATHTPTSWIVTNNLLNYTFSGVGNISGATGLEKDGSASATLSQTGGDNFTGGIMANGGTLVLDNAGSAIGGNLTIAGGATVQIGNGDANGNLPSGNVQDDGTLIFNRSDSVPVATAIAGVGALTQNGSGALTLSGTNTFTGNTTVNAGTLVLTGNGLISSSAQVSVGAATLDVSSVSRTTTLNGLNVANSTLNVSVGYQQAPVNVASLTAGGSGNAINVASLPPIASYPTTVMLIKSASLISGFNFTAGTLPAASPAYAGNVSESADQTSVLLTLTSGPVGVRPYVTWSGADVPNLKTNWSDALNWQSPGTPVATDYVIFSDVAAASGSPFSSVGSGPGGLTSPGNFNNIVDANFTISDLNYSNVLSDYQNTLIPDGVTLNVTGTNTSPRLFTVGSAATDYGSSAAGFVTIAGAKGTLNFNNTNGVMYVGLGSSPSGSSAQATLDLSGLGTLNATVSQFFAGVGSSAEGISQQRESGVVYLALTNHITASVTVSNTETSDTSSTAEAFDIGENDGNGGPQSSLYLGQVNTINADAIGVALQKQNAQILFNQAFSNPSAYFRGKDGVSPVLFWSLGDGVVNSGTATCTGTCDFSSASGGSDGYVNALVNNMYVGRAANNGSGGGTATGTLTFDNGVFNVNTLYLGYQPASSSKIGSGTINVNTNAAAGTSATLTVNAALNLGISTGGSGAASTIGVLNIGGGTVVANSISAGVNSAISVINLNGGTLVISNTAGAPGAPLTTLALTGGTLQLNVNGSAGVTNIIAATVTTSGTTALAIGAIANATTGVTYPLISYTGTDPFGSLSLAPLPAGYVGNLVDDSADGIIGIKFTSIRPPPAVFTGISVSGTTLNLSATGAANGQFVLLGSTNLTLPVSSWTPILTNVFDGSGHLNLSTNVINPAVPREFYLLSQ